MALIACPVCNKQISDQAPLCPGCGHPIQQPRPCRHGWLLGCGCLLAGFFAVLLSIVIGLLIWIGISLQPFGDEEDTGADSGSSVADSQRERCQANLEEIALLKEEWTTAHDAKKGTIIPEPEVGKIFAANPKKLVCPNDDKGTFTSSYELGPIGAPPKCKCDDEHNAADAVTR